MRHFIHRALFFSTQSRIFSSFLFLLLLLFISDSVFSYSVLPSETKFYLEGQMGEARGFLQIPEGGYPGSSDSQRPTLSELGLSHLTRGNFFFQTGMRVVWETLGLFFDYQHNQPVTKSRLRNDLLTHGIFFPRDTVVTAKPFFDLYQMGPQTRISVTKNFFLYPKANLAFLNFHYQLFSADLQVYRNFLLATDQLGLEGEYFLGRGLSLSFNFASSIPKLTILQIRSASVDINFHLFVCTHLDTALYSGIGYQYIDFQDKQKSPNHMFIETSPIGYLGFRFSLI